MKTLVIALLSCSLFATDRYVCHVNPPTGAACSTYSPRYDSYDLAMAAPAVYGDRILFVPQSGSSAESGHVGAYCGGNDSCTAPTVIRLKSGISITTSRYAELPALSTETRITLEYLQGSSPIAAEIRNPVGHRLGTMVTMSYGSQDCNQLRYIGQTFGGSPQNGYTRVGVNVPTVGTWNVPQFKGDSSYTGLYGATLTEDSSTGYHYLRYTITGSSTNYASVIVGDSLQRPAYLSLGDPAAGGKVVVGNPNTGLLIGGCPGGTTCGFEFQGKHYNHVNPAVGLPVEYKLWIAWDSALPDAHVYVGTTNGAGTLSYAGDGTSGVYLWNPTFVNVKNSDPDYTTAYSCPAHDTGSRGIAFSGGNDGNGSPLIDLAYSLNLDGEMAQGWETAFNLNFDQNLLLSDSTTEGIRNPVSTSARHVNIRGNYFATSYRSGSDGSVCCSFPQGPATISNNYVEAMPSGFGSGGTANALHTYPAAIFDFPQSCCTVGWNGTVDYRHNFFWKPEKFRAHAWASTYTVTKGSMWVPSGFSQALHFIAQNSGVTGSTEPAWDFDPRNTNSDGTVTWSLESDPVGVSCPFAECYTAASLGAYSARAYTAGSVVLAGGPCFWQANSSGTAAGTADLTGSCNQGDTISDGGVTWRGLSGKWEATKSYRVGDRIAYNGSGTLKAAGGTWFYIAVTTGTSGGSQPTWTGCATEGCTITSGGVTFVGSLKTGNIYTSKNTGDTKECVGCLWRWNYHFNSFPQNLSGGNQGNCMEFSSQPSAGGTWEEMQITVHGNVFDKCTVGLVLFGADPGGNSDFGSKGLGCIVDPNYTDTTSTCYFNVNPGRTHDLVIRHNRVTNVMQGLNYTGCALPNACPGSQGFAFGIYSMVQGALFDHNTIDAGAAPQSSMFIGAADSCGSTPQKYFPNSRLTISNNIFNSTTGSGPFLRNSCWGDDFPAINTNWAFPFNPPTHIADGWPNYTTAVTTTRNYWGRTVNESVFGNLFINGTLNGSNTVAAQAGANTLPASNKVSPTTWGAIGFRSDYSIPHTSGAHNISGDGSDPGADPEEQGLVRNVTVQYSDRAAVVCYGLTRSNVSIPAVLQLSTSPDFDGSGWVPASVDPSLVAPDANGVTVNSSDYDSYLQNGNNRCHVVSGLTAATKYYDRIHGGGQLYGAMAENNQPPNFTTLATLAGSRSVVVSVKVTSNTIGATGADNLVVEHGTGYSRTAGTLTGSSTTSPVSCTVGGAVCTATFTATAGAPVYYRYKIRDSGNSVLVTQPVQVALPK